MLTKLCVFQVDISSGLAIIIAAKSGPIVVHAIKAIPNSGAGYLSMAVRKRSSSLHTYQAPGCNSRGRSFLSVVAVANDTCMTVEQYYSDDITTAPARRLYASSLHVRTRNFRTEQ